MKNPNMEFTPDGSLMIPQEVDLDTLLSKLQTARIPVEMYGKGAAKTVLDLLSEINEGEAVLTLGVDGTMRRTIGVVSANVFCALSSGEIYRLRENRQEFKDGSVKVRNLDSSIGEKIKLSEKPAEALVRALSEELSIVSIDATYDSGHEERVLYSDTFPGIESTYEMHKFDVIVPESAFVAEGHVEEQQNKTNYYGWELICSS